MNYSNSNLPLLSCRHDMLAVNIFSSSAYANNADNIILSLELRDKALNYCHRSCQIIKYRWPFSFR